MIGVREDGANGPALMGHGVAIGGWLESGVTLGSQAEQLTGCEPEKGVAGYEEVFDRQCQIQI